MFAMGFSSDTAASRIPDLGRLVRLDIREVSRRDFMSLHNGKIPSYGDHVLLIFRFGWNMGGIRKRAGFGNHC